MGGADYQGFDEGRVWVLQDVESGSNVDDRKSSVETTVNFADSSRQVINPIAKFALCTRPVSASSPLILPPLTRYITAQPHRRSPIRPQPPPLGRPTQTRPFTRRLISRQAIPRRRLPQLTLRPHDVRRPSEQQCIHHPYDGSIRASAFGFSRSVGCSCGEEEDVGAIDRACGCYRCVCRCRDLVARV